MINLSDILYDKDGRIYAIHPTEIYIPLEYFDKKAIFAIDIGTMVQTIGILYIQSFKGGTPSGIKLLNIPAHINLQQYDSEDTTIKISGKTVPVRALKYMPDAFVMQQSIEQGREVAEMFLNYILMGKLPKTIGYDMLINLWWRNMEISGADFKVPSKIFEMILSMIYRSPNNTKRRFGEYYGRQSDPDPTSYKTGNVRSIVEGLSTFSGIIFEDINSMITAGVNSSIDGVEESISPLEKIIYM